METLIFHSKTKAQVSALKAIAKALKADFETEKRHYDPALLKKF